MLTRLRQIALHPDLIPPDYAEQLMTADDDDSTVDVTCTMASKDKISLQAQLAQAIENNEECSLCMNILDDPRITRCEHRFCLVW